MSKASSDLIVQQALRLFRVNGYHKTSMADIAAACGLLKGSIYHYFPSKEALALEVLQQLRVYFTKNVFSVAYEEKYSAQQRLVEFTLAVESYFTSREGGCLMGNLALELIDVMPQFADIIRAYFDEWTQALTHILSAKYDEDEALMLAQDAIAKTQGAIMMMRVYCQPDVIHRLNREIFTLLD